MPQNLEEGCTKVPPHSLGIQLFTSASLMAIDHRGSQGQEGQDWPLAVGFLRAWAARLPGSALKMELEAGQRDLLLLTCQE